MSLCWINRLRRTKQPTPCVEFDRPNLWQGPGVILQRAESRFRLILLHTGKKNWFFHHFSHDFFNALVLNKSTTTDYDGINIRPGVIKSIVLTYGKALASFYNGWSLVSDWHCSSQARKMIFFIIFSPDFFMSLCWINRLRGTKHPTPCVEFDCPNLWQGPGVILQRAESRFRLILFLTGKKNWFFHHFSADFFYALVLNKSTTTG